MIPLSTSPLPPVARPGLPAATVSGGRPRDAPPRVGTPLSSTTAPRLLGGGLGRAPRDPAPAARRARETGVRNSPGCGVRTTGRVLGQRRAARPARPERPPARRRRARRALASRATSAATSSRRPAARPSPGPITTASARATRSSSAADGGTIEGMREASGGRAPPASARPTVSGGATACTRPAPAANAARAAIRTAPVIPASPPTTTTRPRVPL